MDISKRTIHRPQRLKEPYNLSPIGLMAAFYRKNNPVNVAFRLKSEPHEMWWLCPNPLWNWGEVDYKEIDIENDEYFW